MFVSERTMASAWLTSTAAVVDVARVLIRRRCDTLCTSGFVDDVML